MNPVRISLLSALALAAMALGIPLLRAEPGGPPQFTLSDQDAREHVIRYPRERTTVFVVADRKGADQIESWISPLVARYQRRIEIFGVADLPNIPLAFHGLFRREFKKRLAYPVMLLRWPAGSVLPTRAAGRTLCAPSDVRPTTHLARFRRLRGRVR